MMKTKGQMKRVPVAMRLIWLQALARVGGEASWSDLLGREEEADPVEAVQAALARVEAERVVQPHKAAVWEVAVSHQSGSALSTGKGNLWWEID